VTKAQPFTSSGRCEIHKKKLQNNQYKKEIVGLNEDDQVQLPATGAL
jgi:hypothetical protein